MVIKVRGNNARNGKVKAVAGSTNSIDSPTFSRGGNDEKSFSMTTMSSLTNMFAVRYTESRSLFKNDEDVKCVTFAATKSNKKSVRFMMDPSDLQKDHCRIYPTNVILTREDRKTQWYNSADIKRMRTETYNEALSARSVSSQYKRDFQHLLSICDDTASELSQQKHLANCVAASQYRGLESLIFVEMIRIDQRQTLQEILAAQDDFRDLIPPNELISKLRATSVKLTNCSSRMAYMMGVGDADEAHSVTEREEIKSLLIRNEQSGRSCIKEDDKNPGVLGGSIDSFTYEI